jgi:hypothetical protein
MGDAAEPWGTLREARQHDNATRYRRCVVQLADYPYRVQQFNHGAHWRVDVLGVDVDFWPHTGTYRCQARGFRCAGRADDFLTFYDRVYAHVSRRHAHPTSR